MKATIAYVISPVVARSFLTAIGKMMCFASDGSLGALAVERGAFRNSAADWSGNG